MFKYITENKSLLAVIAIILASFLWMTSQVASPGGASLLERGARAVAYPFVAAFDTVKGTAKDVWMAYVYHVGLVDENYRLVEQNERLLRENIALKEAATKAGRVDALLELASEYEQPAVAVGVVGRDSKSWFRSVWVDAGKDDGISKDMPASVYAGLVGRVSAVSGSSARVTLITSPRSAVSCITERSRDTGILVGDGTGLCRLKFVDKRADVMQGDLLITSGLDGVYPKGMPVGVVEKVDPDAPGYFQEVTVKPTADLDHLEELLIIKYTEGQ